MKESVGLPALRQSLKLRVRVLTKADEKGIDPKREQIIMNPLKRTFSIVFILALFLASAVWAGAETPEDPDTPDVPQQAQNGQQRPDPPSRVARLQYTTGSVSIQPGGQGDWVEGSLNRPLTSADNIWTDKNSRAELNTGTALLRMNAETSMTVTSIVDQTVQVQLHQGTMNLHIRHLYGGEIYEIDTPNMAFTVQKSGDYRFDVDPNGDASVVTVWKGSGDATGNGPSVHVRAGDQARFVGGTSMVHTIHDAPRNADAFDEWCHVRDQREDHSLSARYVSPDVIGSEDLDHYGSWREIPPYGPTWVPAVAPGWAPYQYGHWIWVEPWGWTWVDDAPWGFAPFHYGRWVYYNNYWGWVPGPLYVQPVYAPALVTFFGGPNFFIGASFGFGGIGWCPLGFGEPFFPFFGVSPGFFNRVNISNTRIVNITNITNNYFNGHNMPQHYANMHVRGGFTAVSRDTMINAHPVNGHTIGFRGNDLNNVRAVNRVPFEPNRTSRLGANAGRPAAAPAPRIAQRPVVSRIGNPAAGPAAGRNGGQVARMPNGGREIPRGVQNPATTGRVSMPERNIPRPSQAGGNVTARNGSAPSVNRGPQPGQVGNRSVPRPPENGSVGGNRGVNNNSPRTMGSNAPRSMGSNVPRPSGQINSPRTAEGPRSVPSRPSPSSAPRPEAGPRNVPRPQGGSVSRPGGSASVPRPTGRVMPARDASPAGGFGSRSGSSGSYGNPSRPSMGPRGSYGGSPRPSMGSGGGYGSMGSRGGYSSPSMGSRGGYSGPSMGSRGSYGGGGGGYSAPRMSAPRSSGGGGGGGSRPSGGGGSAPRSSGHSAPSGGGGSGRSGGHRG
jgi:hypothetical protein